MKTIVCRCEDVTREDIEHALDRGFLDMEEVKRYTAFGTGPCQGKECVLTVASLIAERTARGVHPFVSRAPLHPTPLKLFARKPPAP